MAAAGFPMLDLLAQVAALTAANAALQGQFAGLTAPNSVTYARTPALTGKTDLLDYGKTNDRNIYENGRSPVLSRDNCFDATA